jgi:hypothetical protein
VSVKTGGSFLLQTLRDDRFSRSEPPVAQYNRMREVDVTELSLDCSLLSSTIRPPYTFRSRPDAPRVATPLHDVHNKQAI